MLVFIFYQWKLGENTFGFPIFSQGNKCGTYSMENT